MPTPKPYDAARLTTPPVFPNSKNAEIMNIYKILNILVISLAVSSCHSAHDHSSHEGHHHHEVEPKEAEHEEHDPDEVHLSDPKAASIGMTTEVVALAPFETILRVGGVIESAGRDASAIVAPQSGLVNIVGESLADGSYVVAGQTLATISGKTLQDGDAASRAKADYEAAKKDFERAKSLVGDKIISAKEYDDAVLRYETARTAYEATASRMTSGGVAVKSTTSGHIVSRNVEQGAYVSAGQTLAVVEHCGHKRLRADVPERHFASLAKVKGANFRIATSDTTFSLSDLGGRLLSFGRATTPGNPYIPVTFEFNDDKEIFFAGQYADVFLRFDGGSRAITVPEEAIIESQGLTFVYVKNADEAESYIRREVKTGRGDGRRTLITSGLAEGETVVCHGARRLHVASATSAIPAHTHNH